MLNTLMEFVNFIFNFYLKKNTNKNKIFQLKNKN